MKTLIKFFSVLMVVMGSFVFGQAKSEVTKSYTIDIPMELKSQFTTDDVTKKPKIFTVVNEKPGLTMVFDSSNKIVSIETSSTIYDSYSRLGYNPLVQSNPVSKVPACARRCEDKPTNFGVVLCLYNCLYDALTGG